MFNFLKKLFSVPKEGEVSREEIKVEELNSWFNGKSDKIFSDLDVKIRDIKKNVEQVVHETKDNLAILGTAQLHNPKITVREIQFMEGNRKAYILGVNSFLRGISLEDKNYAALLDFCNDFNIRLDKFSKSTVRPYHILQEFFANEGRNIAINIKNLDASITELRKNIDDANISRVDSIKNSITELNSKIKQKKEIETLLSSKEKDREGLLRNRDEIEKGLGKLVKTEEYEKLQELKANREVALASIREHNAKVIHAFSVMERSLRKLTRVIVEDSELLENYIKDPVKALIKDDSLKIIGLLGKLEKNINNLTLELKDKKRDKVLETVKGLSEDFFRDFVNKHKELSIEVERLEKEVRENETLKKQNRLNYELSNINDNLEKINSEIESNQKELEKINIEEMKKNLEKGINELLKVEIKIT